MKDCNAIRFLCRGFCLGSGQDSPGRIAVRIAVKDSAQALCM